MRKRLLARLVLVLTAGMVGLVVPSVSNAAGPASVRHSSAPSAPSIDTENDAEADAATAFDAPPAMDATSRAAVSSSCAGLDLAHLGYDDFSFTRGYPWRLDAGPEVDLTASWVHGQSRTVSYDPGSGELPVVGWSEPTDFPIFRGVNDLRVHGDELGHTRITWRLVRTDGKPDCTGEVLAFVQHLDSPSTAANVQYRQGHAILDITSPAQGAELEVGRPATVTYSCAYEGTLPTESDCLARDGFGGTHTETFTPTRVGDNYYCFYASVEAVGNPPESYYGWFTGVDCLWYRGVPATVKPSLETEVRLETQVFPSTEWTELAPSSPIVAGNPVRVVTSIRNTTGEVKSVDIAAEDVASGEELDGSLESFEVPAGATYERSARWDTTDRAWAAPGTPALGPTEVEVTVGVGSERHTVRRALFVHPRPVVLVHGWKSYAESSWGAYQGILEEAHPDLRGYAVGDGQFPGRMNTNGGGTGCMSCRTNTVAENAAEEARYVEGVRAATGAWHVDVLAHSMGGLISRYYLQELMPLDGDGRPVVTRLIQMGTPNQGSQLADMLMAFGAGGVDKIPYFPASLHLTPGWVDGYFNQVVTNTRGVPVSNLVGTQIPMVGMPLLPWLAGDGIVPADSARWSLADTVDSPLDFHTAMTESVEDFQKYVLPRLSTPVTRAEVRAARTAQLSAEPVEDDDPLIFEQRSQPNGLRTVQLPAGGTVDLPYQLENATTMGALAVADGLSLTVLDAEGKVLAASDDGRGTDVVQVVTPNFRATRGTGTLRVSDTSGQAREVTVLTFVAGSPLTLEAGTAPWSRGTVAADDSAGQVTARLVRFEQPAAGTLAARVVGRSREVAMVDDGAHGDGVAGDGVYGARLGDLPEGLHPVVVTATTPAGSTRIATTTVVGNGQAEPTEPNGPSEPSEPSEPSGPNGPTEPSGPTAPLVPGTPVHPTAGVDPAGPGTQTGADPVPADRPTAGERLLARYEAVVRRHHLRPAVARTLRATLRQVVRWGSTGRFPSARREARRYHLQLGEAVRRGQVTRKQRVVLLKIGRAATRLARGSDRR